MADWDALDEALPKDAFEEFERDEIQAKRHLRLFRKHKSRDEEWVVAHERMVVAMEKQVSYQRPGSDREKQIRARIRIDKAAIRSHVKRLHL